MAVVNYTCQRIGPNCERITWTLADGDTGAPYRGYDNEIRLVQVEGVFDGATLSIEGSLEETPTNFRKLHDMQGNDLDFTQAGIEQIQEGAVAIRPNCPVIPGSAFLLVIMTVTRSSRGSI